MLDGLHSIRARSISLGADGKWSQYRHIKISQKVYLSPGEAILILVLGILGAVIAIFVYFCVLKGNIVRNIYAIQPADQPAMELIDFNAEPHITVTQPPDIHVDRPVPFICSISEELEDAEDSHYEDDINLL